MQLSTIGEINRDEFIQLVRSPGKAGKVHLESLEKMIQNYPWFQTAHLLYAKAMHESHSLAYPEVLKRTAIAAGDRKVLYRLIQLEPELPATERAVSLMTKDEREENNKAETNKAETNAVAFSNLNFTYELVPGPHTKKPEPPKDMESVKKEENFTTEKQLREEKKESHSNLDEIILKQVADAYVETEIIGLGRGRNKDTGKDVEKTFLEWLQQFRGKGNDESRGQNTGFKEIAGTGLNEIRRASGSGERKRGKEIPAAWIDNEFKIGKLRPDTDFYSTTENAKSSVLEDENLVTETLAKIYRLQGNRLKAIRAYEVLCIKFPERSAFFATQILELKNSG